MEHRYASVHRGLHHLDIAGHSTSHTDDRGAARTGPGSEGSPLTEHRFGLHATGQRGHHALREQWFRIGDQCPGHLGSLIAQADSSARSSLVCTRISP